MATSLVDEIQSVSMQETAAQETRHAKLLPWLTEARRGLQGLFAARTSPAPGMETLAPPLKDVESIPPPSNGSPHVDVVSCVSSSSTSVSSANMQEEPAPCSTTMAPDIDAQQTLQHSGEVIDGKAVNLQEPDVPVSHEAPEMSQGDLTDCEDSPLEDNRPLADLVIDEGQGDLTNCEDSPLEDNRPIADVAIDESANVEYAPDPEPVNPPGAPWHIDIDADMPGPKAWNSANQCSSFPVAGTWQCALMRRLAVDKSTVAGKVWARWAKGAEEIASRYVSNAFTKISTNLLAISKNSSSSGYNIDNVHAMLALAGSDVGDHEATMRQVEGLVGRDLPNAAIALVGPEHLRNISIATRHICEQLISCCTRTASAGDSANVSPTKGDSANVAPEEEHDDDEWPEDSDLNFHQMQRAGLAACSDKLREQGSGGIVVLIVERTEAVPKDTLRDILTSLGMALSDEGVPLFVVFGLQHPPQDCFDLFEGRPLVNLRFLGAANLFDARSVSAEILEWLFQDVLSVIALPPQMMDWLRKDRFENTRQSVSHLMKSLSLLCFGFSTRSPCAGLCAPLDDSVLQNDQFNKEKVQEVFQQRINKLPDIVSQFQPLWEEWNDAVAHMTTKTKRSEASECMAKAATEAVCWRQRLISSLRVWDALCRAIQPMARHEPRLRRLGKLLEELWPKGGSIDQLSLTDAFKTEQNGAKTEQEGADRLVSPCIENVAKEGMLSYKELLELVDELIEASQYLDSKFSKVIHDLKRRATKEKELRAGIKEFLHRVHISYWSPLKDLARIVFREAFSGQCPNDVAQKAEMRLVGKNGSTAESFLKPLSLGSRGSVQTPDDLALLYRLLECSTSKSVEIADLWQAFKNGAMPSRSESTLLLRFGRALLGLHAMGLFTPQNGGRGGTGYSFDQWRLRKKNFGRVWLKAKEVPYTDQVSELCSAVPVSVAEVQLAILESSPSQPKALPAWAQRWVPEYARGRDAPGSLLKRQLQRPSGFDPSAKRARGEKSSKPRIFMS